MNRTQAHDSEETEHWRSQIKTRIKRSPASAVSVEKPSPELDGTTVRQRQLKQGQLKQRKEYEVKVERARDKALHNKSEFTRKSIFCTTNWN